MALSNLHDWNTEAQTSPASACGAGDKGAACGSACGAGDKGAEKPSACGAGGK